MRNVKSYRADFAKIDERRFSIAINCHSQTSALRKLIHAIRDGKVRLKYWRAIAQCSDRDKKGKLKSWTEPGGIWISISITDNEVNRRKKPAKKGELYVSRILSQ
jgi:hypothetical protein